VSKSDEFLPVFLNPDLDYDSGVFIGFWFLEAITGNVRRVDEAPHGPAVCGGVGETFEESGFFSNDL
jgi:hypothetical protein